MIQKKKKKIQKDRNKHKKVKETHTFCNKIPAQIMPVAYFLTFSIGNLLTTTA